MTQDPNYVKVVADDGAQVYPVEHWEQVYYDVHDEHPVIHGWQNDSKLR